MKAQENIKNIISWAKEQSLKKPTTKKALRPALNTQCEEEYFSRKIDNKQTHKKAGGFKNCLDKIIAKEKLVVKEEHSQSSTSKVFINGFDNLEKNLNKIITVLRGRTFVFAIQAQTVSRSLIHRLVNPNKPFSIQEKLRY